MNLLYSVTHLSARLNGQELLLRQHIAERTGNLLHVCVEPASLRILTAVWEVYRAPGVDSPRACEIPHITGVGVFWMWR